MVGATLFDASLLTPESRSYRGSFFVLRRLGRLRPADMPGAAPAVNLLLNMRLPSIGQATHFQLPVVQVWRRSRFRLRWPSRACRGTTGSAGAQVDEWIFDGRRQDDQACGAPHILAVVQAALQRGHGPRRTAAEYLDGEGRAEAKKLSRLAATLYAAESMRLTTRLMQVASWLLLQRAANSGEMTRDQVASEKSKVRLDTASASDDSIGWNELPADFPRTRRPLAQPAGAGARAWTRKSTAPMPGAAQSELPRKSNPVSDQITLLEDRFRPRLVQPFPRASDCLTPDPHASMHCLFLFCSQFAGISRCRR